MSKASTPYGGWADLNFTQAVPTVSDTEVEHFSLKKINGLHPWDIWAVWRSQTEIDEKGSLRQRLWYYNEYIFDR